MAIKEEPASGVRLALAALLHMYEVRKNSVFSQQTHNTG